MGKPQAPQAPDPVQTANAQTASNKETAIAQTGLNAINQVGPNGNITYAQTGKWADGTPRFTQTTTLSPQQQALYNTNLSTQQNLANLGNQQSKTINNVLSKQFNTDGLPAAGNVSAVAGAKPSYQQFGSGPTLSTTGGNQSGVKSSYNAGGDVRSTIDGAGQIQTSLGTNDYSADRQKVEDALMGRLNTQLDRDRSALEAQLTNRGIRVGSDAYTSAMQDFNRGVAENRTSAILGAGQEQNRLQSLALNAGNFANAAQAQQYGQNTNDAAFANAAQAQRNNQNMQAAGFSNAAQQQQFEQALANAGFSNSARQQMYSNQLGATAANNSLADQRFGNEQAIFNTTNAARNQALNERLTTRNQALNENIGLATGAQVQMPQFNSTPQTGIGGTDIAGITANAHNAAMAGYNSQMGQWNNTTGGLFSLGASALPFMFSDRKLKKNIRSTGEEVAGVPVKTFSWRDSGKPGVGVIAQDVEKKHPNLVRKTSDGTRMVNYGGLVRLGKKLEKAA